jgi:uncharacterized protein (TIGR03435 family)
MRRIAFAAVVLSVASALLSAQSPAARSAFEVASIRRGQKLEGPRPLNELLQVIVPVRVLPGGRVESSGHTLRTLIAAAYGLNTVYQKVEGKQDVLDMAFEISAKAAASSLTSAEAKAMVRTLLEDRFRLRWRLQPREIESYALMPARDDARPGPGLRPFTDDCAARAGNAVVFFDGPEYEQKGRCGWSGINGRQRAVGVSTATLADRLTSLMVAPVSDRTGWPGLFTFDLIADTRDMPIEAVRAQARGLRLGAPLPIDAPYLLEVFRRELGLELVKERTTINDFIVERVEPLIEN